MGKNYRQGRLSEEIRRIISEMLISGIKDPRLSGEMLTISGVEVTSDGSYATCYVTILTVNQGEEDTEKRRKEVLDGLHSAKGLMKKEIGKQVKLRHVPELLFKIDDSMEYGRHITQIIDQLGIENYRADEKAPEDEDNMNDTKEETE